MPKKKRSSNEASEELLKELSSLEESMSRRHKKRKRAKEPKKSRFLLAIIINLFLWYFFDHYFVGTVPFINLKFFTVLPFLKAALVVNILADFFLLFHQGKKFYHFAFLSRNLFGMMFLFHFYRIFPFNFSSLAFGSSVDFTVKVGLVLAIAATGATGLVNLLEMILGE